MEAKAGLAGQDQDQEKMLEPVQNQELSRSQYARNARETWYELLNITLYMYAHKSCHFLKTEHCCEMTFDLIP